MTIPTLIKNNQMKSESSYSVEIIVGRLIYFKYTLICCLVVTTLAIRSISKQLALTFKKGFMKALFISGFLVK